MSENIRMLLVKENVIDLRRVTDYLTRNPLASAMEVCEGTGVSVAQISKFIKNGILKIKNPVQGNFGRKMGLG